VTKWRGAAGEGSEEGDAECSGGLAGGVVDATGQAGPVGGNGAHRGGDDGRGE
jgi:hypothetical protein